MKNSILLIKWFSAVIAFPVAAFLIIYQEGCSCRGGEGSHGRGNRGLFVLIQYVHCKFPHRRSELNKF